MCWRHREAKSRQNFALYHCLGPSVQTALFNAPLVVIVGWAINKPMDLNFEIFMIVLLVLSILVVSNFLRDGASNYLEGSLLVVGLHFRWIPFSRWANVTDQVTYLIISVTAYYYPNADVTSSNAASPSAHNTTEPAVVAARLLLGHS